MFLVETDIIKNIEIRDTPTDDLLEVFKICQKLEVLCEKEKGIGVSAIQAGIPWKLFLIKGDGTCNFIEKNKYSYFINCNYYKLENSSNIISLEGCLSIRSPDGGLRFFQVKRYQEINVNGYMLLKDKGNLSLEKFNANLSHKQQGVIFQHEIDHQMGFDGLISNTGKEVSIW